MSTLTRKQKEVREREQRLLVSARKMLIDNGFAGLNLDELARVTDYSKGTVYGHFGCKEDLVTALAIESLEQRLSLFDRAQRFSGLPRERMLAVGIADKVFVRLHPSYFRSELVIKMADLETRVSPERRNVLDLLDQKCITCVREIVDSAVQRGELTFSPSSGPSDLVFALFSMAIGANTAIMNFCPLLEKLQLADPFNSYLGNVQILLDGFGWKPLRTEWDYAATLRQIATEIFPDESRQIGIT